MFPIEIANRNREFYQKVTNVQPKFTISSLIGDNMDYGEHNQLEGLNLGLKQSSINGTNNLTVNLNANHINNQDDNNLSSINKLDKKSNHESRRRRLSDKVKPRDLSITGLTNCSNGESMSLLNTNSNSSSLPDSPARRRIAERNNLDITEGK